MVKFQTSRVQGSIRKGSTMGSKICGVLDFCINISHLRFIFRESNNIPGIPHKALERNVRREVANSNERRRMQNINNGFEDLRALVCNEDDGRISKVSLDFCQ